MRAPTKPHGVKLSASPPIQSLQFKFPRGKAALFDKVEFANSAPKSPQGLHTR